MLCTLVVDTKVAVEVYTEVALVVDSEVALEVGLVALGISNLLVCQAER